MSRIYAPGFISTPSNDVPLVGAEASADARGEKMLKNIVTVNKTKFKQWSLMYMAQHEKEVASEILCNLTKKVPILTRILKTNI